MIFKGFMKIAKVFSDINEFVEELDLLRSLNKKVVVTSGGFAPLHIGHLRCIRIG